MRRRYILKKKDIARLFKVPKKYVQELGQGSYESSVQGNTRAYWEEYVRPFQRMIFDDLVLEFRRSAALNRSQWARMI